MVIKQGTAVTTAGQGRLSAAYDGLTDLVGVVSEWPRGTCRTQRWPSAWSPFSFASGACAVTFVVFEK
jgi:hypothetical protein